MYALKAIEEKKAALGNLLNTQAKVSKEQSHGRY